MTDKGTAMTETLVLEKKESLSTLAREINEEHRLCNESLKAGLSWSQSKPSKNLLRRSHRKLDCKERKPFPLTSKF